MALFWFGKKIKKIDDISSCCAAKFTHEIIKNTDEFNCNKGIRLLGGGCANCHKLEENTKAALIEMGCNEQVELITDFEVIASYGIMSTPALVIDNKVVAYGKVLKTDEIIRLYKEVRS